MSVGTLREVVDRVRRIETRLTRYLETQGFDTQVKRAEWRADDRTVITPSMMTPLKELLDTMPASWPREDAVRVEHKGVLVAWLFKP